MIDLFRATYVSLVELAAGRGMHPTLVKRFLDEEGISRRSAKRSSTPHSTAGAGYETD